MYANEMPIVSISTCRIFFVTLTRFQTWYKDKISLFSFNIFYFVGRLIRNWNRYRRKYCERVSFISADLSSFSTRSRTWQVHQILNIWWKSFCSREPTNTDSKTLRALYTMSGLRGVCFKIKHTLFTDLNRIGKASFNKPHKRLWEKGNWLNTLLYSVLYCTLLDLSSTYIAFGRRLTFVTKIISNWPEVFEVSRPHRHAS